MSALVPSLVMGCLGVATGIFFVLSMVEKPVWKVMWQPRATDVSDDLVRAIHAQLKRVIHLLPPTMLTTIAIVTVFMVIQLFQSGFTLWAWIVPVVFWGQKILVLMRLKKRHPRCRRLPFGR